VQYRPKVWVTNLLEVHGRVAVDDGLLDGSGRGAIALLKGGNSLLGKGKVRLGGHFRVGFLLNKLIQIYCDQLSS
jgi:glutamate 5-kinase